MTTHHRQCTFLKRGRERHRYLRKVLDGVKCIDDLSKTYISELATYLITQLPTVSVTKRIRIKAEIPILNRRPDFVIFIPGIALILLEYKTSNKTLKLRGSYLVQTKDTLKKMSAVLPDSSSNNKIQLLSLLLIRNATTRKNRVICIKKQDIENRNIYLF